MNTKMQKGFTLVEIMIVVAIIAILAAIAIPNFIKYRTESQNNSCVSTMASIQTAAENWLSKPGRGATAPTMTQLVDDGKGYFKNEPKCPGGGTYEITLDANNAIVVTCSKGHTAETEEAPEGGSETP